MGAWPDLASQLEGEPREPPKSRRETCRNANNPHAFLPSEQWQVKVEL